jgi:hypothetical protein
MDIYVIASVFLLIIVLLGFLLYRYINSLEQSLISIKEQFEEYINSHKKVSERANEGGATLENVNILPQSQPVEQHQSEPVEQHQSEPVEQQQSEPVEQLEQRHYNFTTGNDTEIQDIKLTLENYTSDHEDNLENLPSVRSELEDEKEQFLGNNTNDNDNDNGEVEVEVEEDDNDVEEDDGLLEDDNSTIELENDEKTEEELTNDMQNIVSKVKSMKVNELREFGLRLGFDNINAMRKNDLRDLILDRLADN